MAGRLNCELFQIRANAHRFTVQRGLAVTAFKDLQFIDPQVEPGYNTSWGPAEPEHLRLALSKSFGPQKKLERGSLNPGILSIKRLGELARYRLHPETPNHAGMVALVSVVDHDYNLLNIVAYRQHDREHSVPLGDYQIRGRDRRDLGPHVGLVLLEAGTSISVKHDRGGEHYSSIQDIRLVYDPESSDGLIRYVETDDPKPTDPPDLSGVREPLNRPPSAPTTAEALELATA